MGVDPFRGAPPPRHGAPVCPPCHAARSCAHAWRALPLESPPRTLLPCPAPQVRHELELGHSVRYLLPDAVVQYIYSHGLYNTATQRPRVLHWADRKVDRDQDA